MKNKINMYESELKLANVDTCSIWNDLPCVHCRRTWYRDFLISKATGFLSGYITYRLAIYWEAKGILPELDFFKGGAK